MGRTDRCAALRKPNGVVSSQYLEGHAAAAGLYCPTGLELGIVGLALGQLVRSRFRSRWVFRFGAMPLCEVNDSPGQEIPDPLPPPGVCIGNAYEVWDERDKLNLYIIHGIQTLPSDPCHSNGLQAIKKSITGRIYSVDWILHDMWVRTFYIMHRQEASLVGISTCQFFPLWQVRR